MHNCELWRLSSHCHFIRSRIVQLPKTERKIFGRQQGRKTETHQRIQGNRRKHSGRGTQKRFLSERRPAANKVNRRLLPETQVALHRLRRIQGSIPELLT